MASRSDFIMELKHARKGRHTVIWKGKEFDFDSIASSNEVYIVADGERYRVNISELKPGVGFTNSFSNGQARAHQAIANKAAAAGVRVENAIDTTLSFPDGTYSHISSVWEDGGQFHATVNFKGKLITKSAPTAQAAVSALKAAVGAK